MGAITVQGGKGSLELDDDGIIHLSWKPDVRIDAADARAAIAAVNIVANGTGHPLLVTMDATESLSRTAREVFTAPCAASRVALLGSSPVDRVTATWSHGLQDLPCPTRFFTSESDARKWLLLPERASRSKDYQSR